MIRRFVETTVVLTGLLLLGCAGQNPPPAAGRPQAAGDLDQPRVWADLALERLRQAPADEQSVLCVELGKLFWRLNSPDGCVRVSRQADHIASHMDKDVHLLEFLVGAAQLAAWMEDLPAARRRAKQAEDLLDRVPADELTTSVVVVAVGWARAARDERAFKQIQPLAPGEETASALGFMIAEQLRAGRLDQAKESLRLLGQVWPRQDNRRLPNLYFRGEPYLSWSHLLALQLFRRNSEGAARLLALAPPDEAAFLLYMSISSFESELTEWQAEMGVRPNPQEDRQSVLFAANWAWAWLEGNEGEGDFHFLQEPLSRLEARIMLWTPLPARPPAAQRGVDRVPSTLRRWAGLQYESGKRVEAAAAIERCLRAIGRMDEARSRTSERCITAQLALAARDFERARSIALIVESPDDSQQVLRAIARRLYRLKDREGWRLTIDLAAGTAAKYQAEPRAKAVEELALAQAEIGEREVASDLADRIGDPVRKARVLEAIRSAPNGHSRPPAPPATTPTPPVSAPARAGGPDSRPADASLDWYVRMASGYAAADEIGKALALVEKIPPEREDLRQKAQAEINDSLHGLTVRKLEAGDVEGAARVASLLHDRQALNSEHVAKCIAEEKDLRPLRRWVDRLASPYDQALASLAVAQAKAREIPYQLAVWPRLVQPLDLLDWRGEEAKSEREAADIYEDTGTF